MTATHSVDRPRTYGELRRRTDDTRWELIDGEAYAMTGPSWQHQSVVAGLAAQLVPHFRALGCRVLPAPLDVRLPRSDEPDDEVETTVQPDISVVCDLGKPDDRGCRGAPDLVVEVLSPCSRPGACERPTASRGSWSTGTRHSRTCPGHDVSAARSRLRT